MSALGAGSGAVVYGCKKPISAATRKKGTHHHVDPSPTGRATGEDRELLTNTVPGQATVSAIKYNKLVESKSTAKNMAWCSGFLVSCHF